MKAKVLKGYNRYYRDFTGHNPSGIKEGDTVEIVSQKNNMYQVRKGSTSANIPSDFLQIK